MRRVKTPRDAKGSQALKILRKTSTSVFASRMPARSAGNMRHAHSLISARQIVRIDRQPWEERVANILQVIEDHRYGRANALHNAISEADKAKQKAMKKTLEAETFAEEVQAANEEMRANAEEMRAANEEMRANAEEMRAANEEMRLVSEELERMHSDVEQLSPVFSTSFATTLNEIQGHAADLLENLGKDLDARTKTKLEYVSEKSANMEMMVNQLLGYWKVELEGKTLETTDLEMIFENVLSNLKGSIEEAKADITHDQLPEAVVDSSQFTLLFESLIKNCLVFCKEKTPRIHVWAENIGSTDIEMPEPKMEKGWIICVKDNGKVIPQEEHHNIFRVFNQRPKSGDAISQTISETKAQTAPQDNSQAWANSMGLAIAWRIVKRHGGQIWLASSSQKGNIWCFLVPEYDVNDADV